MTPKYRIQKPKAIAHIPLCHNLEIIFFSHSKQTHHPPLQLSHPTPYPSKA